MQLVILAAGMGSRFGGLKQMEKMDEAGNFLLDYSVYDAKRAVFDSVVFIIKKEFYDTQTKYYEEKIEEYKNEIYELKDCLNRYDDLGKKIDEIPDTYSECLELLKFTLKIIPIEYRKQLYKEFKGKLKHFTFKEEI